jgi:hypothetical protein
LSFFISVNRFSVVSRVNIYSVASSIKQLTQSEYIGLILFRRLAYCFNVGKRPCISGSNYQNQKLLDTLKNLVYIFNMFEQLMKHLFLNIYIKWVVNLSMHKIMVSSCLFKQHLQFIREN